MTHLRVRLSRQIWTSRQHVLTRLSHALSFGVFASAASFLDRPLRLLMRSAELCSAAIKSAGCFVSYMHNPLPIPARLFTLSLTCAKK